VKLSKNSILWGARVWGFLLDLCQENRKLTQVLENSWLSVTEDKKEVGCKGGKGTYFALVRKNESSSSNSVAMGSWVVGADRCFLAGPGVGLIGVLGFVVSSSWVAVGVV